MNTYKYIRSYKGRPGVAQEVQANDYADFLAALESWRRESLDRHGKPVYTYAAVSQPEPEDMDL
jgi:hypothetical protein